MQPLSGNLDPEKIRADFPILSRTFRGRKLVYLDNAATTQKPLCVIEAIKKFYAENYANVYRGVYELSQRATEAYEAARQRVARFINARSEREIVFTRSTTESINLVAWSWGLQNLGPGDVILLTELEHHSNLVPWQLVAQRTGARLVFIPISGPEGYIETRIVADFLRPPVKIFAFTQVSNSLGVINPAAEWCAVAKSRGILTLVDAAQSAGHMPLNVQEIGCDFLAFSGHKMCGPTGIGVLYGRSELLESIPPYQAGGEMILEVHYDHSTWAPIPHKFEAGTPNIAGAIGLHVALDYLDSVGRDRIAEHENSLAQYALERMLTIPEIRVYGPKLGEPRAGVISFTLGTIHAHDIVTAADQFGIALRGGHHCTQPLMRKLGVPATARASFYLYNTQEEVDLLVEALREIYRFFSRK